LRSGLNSDVERGGKTYHVQTEDGGIVNPVILTRLFSNGVLLSQRKTGYVYLLEREDLSDVVDRLMREQHQAVVTDLQQGVLDGEK
jgi:hypothetical protein